MKANNFIIGILILTIGLSACQNKSSDNESDNTSMSMGDITHMNMDSSMNAGMMGAMDNMMNEMHAMEMSGNVDHDFAMMMKSHHQAAIDMAQAELSSGKDEKLKEIAQKIIQTQQSEINELEAILNSTKNAAKNYDPTRKDDGFAKVMEKNMTMMMEMPKSDGSLSTDHQFANMVIPHHQSAVFMAEGFKQHGKDAKLLSMAKKMVTDQNKEIEEFKKWKANNQ